MMGALFSGVRWPEREPGNLPDVKSESICASVTPTFLHGVSKDSFGLTLFTEIFRKCYCSKWSWLRSLTVTRSVIYRKQHFKYPAAFEKVRTRHINENSFILWEN